MWKLSITEIQCLGFLWELSYRHSLPGIYISFQKEIRVQYNSYIFSQWSLLINLGIVETLPNSKFLDPFQGRFSFERRILFLNPAISSFLYSVTLITPVLSHCQESKRSFYAVKGMLQWQEAASFQAWGHEFDCLCSPHMLNVVPCCLELRHTTRCV